MRTAMLGQTAAFGLNHLLDQNLWARERLRPHAGQTIEFRTPPLPPARLQIDESGHVGPAESLENDLVVTTRPGVIAFLIRRGPDTAHAFDFVGREDLADTVRDLLRHLEWDAVEDLSRLVGDVAAHRVVSAGRDLAAWQREAAERLAQNFAEYVSEEKPLVLSRAQFESLQRQTAELVEALDRLEQRIQGAEVLAATVRGSTNPG